MQSEKNRIKHFDHCIVHVVHEHMPDAALLHVFKHAACFERAEDPPVAVWSEQDVLVFCQKQPAVFGQGRKVLLTEEMDVVLFKSEVVMFPEKTKCLCVIDITCHDVPLDRTSKSVLGCFDLFRLQFKKRKPVKGKRAFRPRMFKTCP